MAFFSDLGVIMLSESMRFKIMFLFFSMTFGVSRGVSFAGATGRLANVAAWAKLSLLGSTPK